MMRGTRNEWMASKEEELKEWEAEKAVDALIHSATAYK